jgi:hypothetical protein
MAAGAVNNSANLFNEHHYKAANEALLEGRKIRVLQRGETIDIRVCDEIRGLEFLILFIKELLGLVNELRPEELFQQSWKIWEQDLTVVDTNDLVQLKKYVQIYQTFDIAKKTFQSLDGFKEGIELVESRHADLIDNLKAQANETSSLHSILRAFAVREIAGTLLSAEDLISAEQLCQKLEEATGSDLLVKAGNAATTLATQMALFGDASGPMEELHKLNEQLAQFPQSDFDELSSVILKAYGDAEAKVIEKLEGAASSLEAQLLAANERLAMATQERAVFEKELAAKREQLKSEKVELTYPTFPMDNGKNTILDWVRQCGIGALLTPEERKTLSLVNMDLLLRTERPTLEEVQTYKQACQSLGITPESGATLLSFEQLDNLLDTLEVAVLKRMDELQETMNATCLAGREKKSQIEGEIAKLKESLAELPVPSSFGMVMSYFTQNQARALVEEQIKGLEREKARYDGNSRLFDVSLTLQDQGNWGAMLDWIGEIRGMLRSGMRATSTVEEISILESKHGKHQTESYSPALRLSEDLTSLVGHSKAAIKRLK